MNVLEDLRVLDLSAGTTGSLTAALLADFGADVISAVRADPRTSSGVVSPDWVVSNRGKRLGVTDAASAAEPSALIRLAETSHVVIANDAESLRSVAITADSIGTRVALVLPAYFGDSAPWIGGAESVELLTALSGLPANQSSYSGRPVDAAYPYLRYAHAAWAAACVLAALVERGRSGRGQVVSVSGLHAANLFCGYLYARPDSVKDPLRTSGSGGLHPVYRRYQAADGKWLFVGGLGPKFGRAVLELTGSLGILDDPRVGGRLEQIWAPANSGWVISHLEAVFSRQPAAHWLSLLEAADVPCTELFSREEWFAGDQVAASGQRQETVDPILGPMVVVGPPVAIGDAPQPVLATAEAVPIADLSWLGSDTWLPKAEESSELPTGRGPLAGTRIATMGSYVAGPYVGCLLAELGADVIKVEPPPGDPWRLQGFAYNRGARGLAVDMRGAEGNAAVHRVLNTCDLVLDNFRLGVGQRLGIGHEQLQANGRATVTVSVTAYGESGPLAELPGYDTVVQAVSGMMTALGGTDEPVMSSLPSIDHTTAAVGAFGAVLGLLHRDRVGEALHVSASLAWTSLFIQAPELIDFKGRPPGRIGGRDFVGPGPLDRIYAVADGFVRIQVPQLDVGCWSSAGLALDEQTATTDPAAAIAAALQTLPREQALNALRRAGVPAAAVRGLEEIVNDPVLHSMGVLESLPVSGPTRMVAPGRFARFSRTQQDNILPTPGLGEHTSQLLTEVGYPPTEIQRLQDTGQVVSGGPLDLVYLPPYR